MDISYQYSKVRREFGRQPQFCELGPLLCDNIAADATQHAAYMLRNPVHRPVQHGPRLSERLVNTVRAEYASTSINHAEGGWPRDVNPADPELTQRYRRKVEKDDGYVHCVQTVAPGMDHYIQQNNAIDMYRTYHAELAQAEPPERLGCRTVNVYREPCAVARPVSAVSWQPEGGRRFAVAHCDLDLERRARAPLDCFVWDAENARAPESTLAPPCSLLDVQFNPRSPATLAGGLANGQVAVWDLRAGPGPVLACAPHVAHRDMARCVMFAGAKSGREFFSGSPDGACKWWDARDMSAPADEMIIHAVKNSFDVPSMAAANGASVLEFEASMPSRFMVGSEDGFVVVGNRKGKTPLEKLPAKFPAHAGPVWALERNPGFLKNFLSVGAWSARVWSEECRDSAVLWTAPQRHRLTAGVWSPTRWSLALVTQWNGVLAAWDVLRRAHSPVLRVQVCSEPLLRVRAHEQGAMVACGSQKGNIYMLELSQSFVQSGKNDKNLLMLMLERETKRERILEARLREIRLKQRQAEEGEPVEVAEAAPGDRDLAEAAAAYSAQVRREQAAL